MVENINEECVAFVKEYYKTITRTPKLISKFYSPNAQVSVHFETEEPRVYTENHAAVVLDKHKKKIEKVLISALDCQKIGDLLLVCVIGEFVYSNNAISRYVQQFVVEKTGKYRILNDNCRLLDEEVIFETKKSKKDVPFFDSKIGYKVNFEKGAIIKVTGGGDVNRSRIFDAFHNVGRIWAIEIKDDKCFVEFSKSEDIQKIKTDEILKNYGFEVNTAEPVVRNY